MTILDCSVTGCMYNEANCCHKGNIKVEGEDAKESEDTCCGSFAERGDRKILKWHVVLRTVSLIRKRNAAQTISVSRVVMPATAEKRNAQVSAAAKKFCASGNKDGKTGDFV